jgi:hypothetical protein
MSRTIRRPNYLNEVRADDWRFRMKHKLAHWFKCEHEPPQPMGKVELRKRQTYLYGDTHRNARSPGRYYRQTRETELRTLCKEELLRFRKDPEHEVIVPDNPTSCLWDWD